MGMFDNIKCKYPLPIDGYQDCVFQTKDTPAQFMDNYEIREDGTLWHLDYDIKTVEDGGWENINSEWKPVPFTGSIRFYDIAGPNAWIEFVALIKDGKTVDISLLRDKWDN